MSDELEQAAELEELERNIALANRKHPEMTFTGACYYCEEAVSTGCFCSPECCEDFQRIERASSIAR